MMMLDPSTDQEEVWDDIDTSALAEIEEEPGPVTVAHVWESCNGYPGETITLFTRLEIREKIRGLSLHISLPEGLTLGNYRAPAALEALIPTTELDSQGNTYIVWSLPDDLSLGRPYEFQTDVNVEPTPYNHSLISRAIAMADNLDASPEETARLSVQAKGRYLRYLPSVYERDDLMARFLMLFESFWLPINQQIDAIHYYFDPRITPVDFLPWLASWLDLELDERWPVPRQRQLVRWAIALHRSRGTKWGLLKYLEIYTGQKAEIVERRAKNFILGSEARMGPSIALGRGNRPHTFTVNLRLPPVEADSEKERKRLEAIRQHTIESIIEMQKPGHTVYTLNIEPLTEASKSPEATPATKQTTQEDEIAAQAAIWFKLDE